MTHLWASKQTFCLQHVITIKNIILIFWCYSVNSAIFFPILSNKNTMCFITFWLLRLKSVTHKYTDQSKSTVLKRRKLNSASLLLYYMDFSALLWVFFHGKVSFKSVSKLLVDQLHPRGPKCCNTWTQILFLTPAFIFFLSLKKNACWWFRKCLLLQTLLEISATELF